MSVLCECRHGDSIYIIENFIDPVIDSDGQLDMEKSNEFKVDDRVVFLDWYYENTGGNQYTYIKFRDQNGRIFTAVETYFVTEEACNGIEWYFKQYFSSK